MFILFVFPFPVAIYIQKLNIMKVRKDKQIWNKVEFIFYW